MFDFVVLGATGMQGRIASRDLLKNGYSVLLSGRDKNKVKKLLHRYKKAEFEFVDLSDQSRTISVIKIAGAPVVLNCAEGDYNLSTAKACLKAGVHYLDLGSDQEMTHDQFELSDAFKKKDLTALLGCGSAPGVVNVMARYAGEGFDAVETVNAGFAWNSSLPVFVVPFSIESITGEFTEPSNVLERGKFVLCDPKSCKEQFHYFEIGSQKTYYTKHPEPYTFSKYFRNKGIQNSALFSSFPDHSRNAIETIIVLGLDSKKPIAVGEHPIKPVNILTETLKRLSVPKGYTEKENLWVKISGTKDGLPKETQMDCLAETLKGWEDATCNIDTGMPAAIMAVMVKNGAVKERGVFSPEFAVPWEPFFKELAKRKIRVYENGARLN